MTVASRPLELEALLEAFLGDAAPGCCAQEAMLASYSAGELGADERATFETHLRGCDACSADMAQFERLGPLWDAPAQNRANRLAALLSRIRPIWLVAAVAVCAAIAVAPALVDSDKLRAKGEDVPGFALDVAVQRDGAAFRAKPGATLRTGDRLGFFYSATVPGHLAIFYADESPHFERVFPANEARSAPIAAGRDVPVPDGALLVDGVGCEWVIGFFSRAPLTEGAAQAAVQSMLSSRRGCQLGSPLLADVEARVLEVRR